MAKQPKAQPEQPANTSRLRGFWARRISRSVKDYQDFHRSGQVVVDTYRIENKSTTQADKYNILYSITETVKPSMYSQTPKPEVKQRHVDTNNPIGIAASLLMEAVIQYTIDEQDFDQVMNSAVEDFLLPGLGTVWCRYEPTISTRAKTDSEGNPLTPAETEEYVTYERVAVEFVLWKDFLSGRARNWEETPWVARAIYMDKDAMLKQGIDPLIIAKVEFKNGPARPSVTDQQETVPENQVRVWEIWDKKTRTIVWFTDAYADGVLKVAKDFLNLENFYPTPRPMRAVTTNNKFIPRPFYCEYQAQAEELNDITHRIRRLVKALRVVGIYDASLPALQQLLTGNDNKMIPVEGWATVQEKGGIKGTVDFLGIQDIAAALMQLYDARERVKGEIYEITGWSDIIRGVSKASETLGAQQIKAQWAGARLKLLQKDVQRFVRDIFRIIGEIAAEHFSTPMLLLMSGVPLNDYKSNPQLAATFAQVVQTIRDEKERCALIGVETDSTLLPDEENDKKERTEFVAAIGAYLQQAVPAMQTLPALGPLLGEIMMFAVRSFRGARPLEQAFEQFRAQVAANPPQSPDKGGDQGKAAAATATAQAKSVDSQIKLKLGTEQNQLDAQGLALEREKEMNRHNEKMAELQIRAKEVGISEGELVQKDQHRILDNIENQAERLDAAQARQEDRADARDAAARDSAERAADRRLEASNGGGTESA